ncbi:MAG TPA: serine hydrolase, partial [Steroidobacteraceae bacterium]|nr:serine hydrolase [Steroidobacteraceae bacterium]
MKAQALRRGAGIATLVAMLVATAAHAAPPEGFEARVEALRKASGVPGMWIAIVEQGNPTLARGFGVRKLGDPAPVGPDTIFPTGSTGKAV